MTSPAEYRSLAHRIRETARLQLHLIRQARMAQLDAPQAASALGDLADGILPYQKERRQRRAERLAYLAGRSQTGQILTSARADMMPDVTRSFTGSTESVREVVHLVTDNVQDLRPDPEFFGPFQVAETGTVSPDDRGPESEFFGPFWNTNAADPEPVTRQVGASNSTDICLSDIAEVIAPEHAVALKLPADDQVLSSEPSPTDKANVTTVAVPVTLHDQRIGNADGIAADLSFKECPEDHTARPHVNSLSSLPGAGPSVIWMLQKCGISTLADLAASDAAILIPRLGLVGQIIDIQAWQRYAQIAVGNPQVAVSG